MEGILELAEQPKGAEEGLTSWCPLRHHRGVIAVEGKPLILVVDDERPTTRLLQINLEAEGYEVLTAFDGREALQSLEGRKPDLIILDLLLPQMDGYEVLEHIRADPRTRDIPVILLTGRRSPDEIAEGWRYEIDLYLTKPYNVDDLLALVRRVVEMHREEKVL